MALPKLTRDGLGAGRWTSPWPGVAFGGDAGCKALCLGGAGPDWGGTGGFGVIIARFGSRAVGSHAFCPFGHGHGSMYRPSATEHSRSPNANSGLASRHHSNVTVRCPGDAVTLHERHGQAYYAHHPGLQPRVSASAPRRYHLANAPRPRSRHIETGHETGLSRYLRLETSMRRLSPWAECMA